MTNFSRAKKKQIKIWDCAFRSVLVIPIAFVLAMKSTRKTSKSVHVRKTVQMVVPVPSFVKTTTRKVTSIF